MRRALVIMLLGCGALAAPPPKQQPWLGMSIRAYQEPSGERFLHIERVAKGGPAERAGILPGDIVTSLGGAPLRFLDDLDVLMYLGERKPGERLPMRIVRSGSHRNVVIVVGVMPDAARAAWERALHVARRKRLNAQQVSPPPAKPQPPR